MTSWHCRRPAGDVCDLVSVTMGPGTRATWAALRLATKAVLGGGSVYLAHNQGLLGDSEQGAAVLHRVLGALPPAVEEWAKYLRLQLPAVPKVNFSFCEVWNSGVQKSTSALSGAPAKSCEYASKGWLYMKNLAKGEH